MKYIDGGFLMEGVRVYIITPLVFPLFASCADMNQISCPPVLVIRSHASLPFYLLPILKCCPGIISLNKQYLPHISLVMAFYHGNKK